VTRLPSERLNEKIGKAAFAMSVEGWEECLSKDGASKNQEMRTSNEPLSELNILGAHVWYETVTLPNGAGRCSECPRWLGECHKLNHY
jgi:hypothetical protein